MSSDSENALGEKDSINSTSNLILNQRLSELFVSYRVIKRLFNSNSGSEMIAKRYYIPIGLINLEK